VARREIAADRDEGLDAGLARSREDGVTVIVKTGIIQMRVGIDQHGLLSKRPASSPQNLACWSFA